MELSILTAQLIGIQWLEVITLGLVGALLYKLVSYRKTGRHQKYSPKTFNFKYWITDQNNWNDLLLSCILFLVIVVFKDQLIIWFPTNDSILWLTPIINHSIFYLVLGFSMTWIVKKFRTWTQSKDKE